MTGVPLILFLGTAGTHKKNGRRCQTPCALLVLASIYEHALVSFLHLLQVIP